MLGSTRGYREELSLLCLKRLEQYLLAPKLCQEEASAVKKLGKNNKTTPLARAGNTLARVNKSG